jgi:hypothetical protein
MAVTIELDVSVDAVDKVAQTLIVMLRVIERFEKPVEPIRDDVFAAKKTPPGPPPSCLHWLLPWYA